MKTVFAVVGVLALVFVVVLAGLAGFAYLKGPGQAAKQEAKVIEEVIKKQHPSERVTVALRRIQNNIVMHASIGAMMITAPVLSLLRTDTPITERQVLALEDAAQSLDKSDISMKDAQAFIQRHKDLFPQGQGQQQRYTSGH